MMTEIEISLLTLHIYFILQILIFQTLLRLIMLINTEIYLEKMIIKKLVRNTLSLKTLKKLIILSFYLKDAYLWQILLKKHI